MYEGTSSIQLLERKMSLVYIKGGGRRRKCRRKTRSNQAVYLPKQAREVDIDRFDLADEALRAWLFPMQREAKMRTRMCSIGEGS